MKHLTRTACSGLGVLAATTMMLGPVATAMPSDSGSHTTTTPAAKSTVKTPRNLGAPAAASTCTAAHIVSVPGTGGTYPGAPNDVTNAMEGAVALNAAKTVGTDKVSTWQASYPASAGAAWSATSEHNVADTYGHSRLLGDKAVIDHLKEYEASCPDAKIALVGFSQGASVAGDSAALLAHGAVQGIGPDDIIGAILLADPERSGPSAFTGPAKDAKTYIPIPSGAVYQRNGEMSVESPDTIGWAGQRSVGFDGIDGKVISICNPADTACSVPRGSFQRALADISDKNIGPNQTYISGPAIKPIIDSGAISALIGPMLTGGVVTDILAGNLKSGLDKADTAVDASALAADQKGQVHNVISEIRAALSLMPGDDAYGPGVTDKQIMAHLITAAAPLIKGKVPPQLQPVVDALSVGLGGGGDLPADVKARVEKIITQIANFQDEHGKYFSTYQVEGKISSDWASEALATGITNALSGKANTLPAGAKPRTGAETAELSRADDGLRALLSAGTLPPENSTQNIPVVVGNPLADPMADPTSVQSGTTPRPSGTSTPTTSVTTSSTSTSATESTPSTSASAALVSAAKTGPAVDTGGEVEMSWISRLTSIFA